MQTEKNIWLRMLSMILTLALLISCIPNQVYAMAGEALADWLGANDTAVLQPNATPDPVLSTAHIVAEDESRRGETYKEYIMNNGLRLATVYPSAIHYEENGVWKDIDNTLVAAVSNGKDVYQNAAGAWNVRFPQNLSGSDMVGVTKDGHTVQFGMAGELRSTGDVAVASVGQIGATADTLAVSNAQTATAQIQQLDLTAARAAAEHPEAVLDKLNSRLSYANVYPNTNVVYDLQGNQLKESIVLQRYDADLWGYRYTLDTGDLVPVLREDQQIDLCHPETNEVVLIMPAPYMLDDNGETSYDVEVVLTQNGSNYLLSYYLPRAWLAEADRAWPVILDPVIEFAGNSSNVDDITVAENYNEAVGRGVIQCGYYAPAGAMRMYMRFVQLPNLTAGDIIVDATIRLHKPYNSGTTANISIQKVTEEWSHSDISWTNQPTVDNAIADYVVCRSAGHYTWNITNMVRDWYEIGNYGMMFRTPDAVEDAGVDNWKQFYSSEFNLLTNDIPLLTISYQSHNGLEDYWSCSSASAGRAGTGYVNLFTGNLTWVRGDLGFDGNRMPVSISHIYNSNDSQTNQFGMGYGWRTNFNQTIARPDLDTVSEDNIFVWEDGDGTSHYFYPAKDSEDNTIPNTYLDEDGLHLTLTTGGSGDQTYTLTDQYGNKSYFDETGRIVKMENNQQVKSNITVTYTTTTSKLISTITDGAGRVYQFLYQSNLLSKISYLGTDVTEDTCVLFAYDNGNLVKITDKDTLYTTYSYDGHLLTKVEDVPEKNADGEYVVDYYITYSYKEDPAENPVRPVAEVKEYDSTISDDIPGNSASFTYGTHYAEVKDHNGNEVYYQFNDWGNLIATHDSEGHSQFTKYALNDVNESYPDTAEPHQVIEVSDIDGTITNLYPNSGFENMASGTVPAGWETHSKVSTEYKYQGNKSMKISAEAVGDRISSHGPGVNVEPGETYTFSAYVLLTKDTKAYVSFDEIAPRELVGPLNQWMRIQISYTNEDESNKTVHPYFSVWFGTIYVDCVQMEKTASASPYNAAENGEFKATISGIEKHINGWTASDSCTSADNHYNGTAANSILSVDNLCLHGNPSTGKYYMQEIKMNGVRGDAFVLAGWAMANAAPLTEYQTANQDGSQAEETGRVRKFGLKLIFKKDNTTVNEHYVSFDPDISADRWQYAALTAIADGEFDSITIQIAYSYQVNIAYFDGIQLTEGGAGTRYEYDTNKNVVKETNVLGQATEYIYYGNGIDLKSVKPAVGSAVSYTYDAYHNVKTMVETTENPDGDEYTTTYLYKYDAYGNVESTTITQSCDDPDYVPLVQKTATTYTIYDPATGSTAGNYVHTTTDGNGKTTTYNYDPQTGVLLWVQYPEDIVDLENDIDTRTYYEYDEMYRLKKTYATTDQNKQMSATYSYAEDLLTSLVTKSTTYTYTYDKFDLRTSVKIGNRTLATYSYTDEDDGNHLLERLDYANGNRVEYKYDGLGRVTKEEYYEAAEQTEPSRTIRYYYDNAGAMARMKDSATGIETTCYYDYAGRVGRLEETDDQSFYHVLLYAYDDNGNIIKMEEYINRQGSNPNQIDKYNYYCEYIYGYKNRLEAVDTGNAHKDYVYDGLDRVTNEVVSKVEVTGEGEDANKVITKVFENEYSYHPATVGETSVTTYQVARKKTTSAHYANNLTYAYDDNGNIISISDGNRTITYAYDSANQLIRENNPYVNRTWVWTYDVAGNLTSKKEYTYSTASTSALVNPISENVYSYGNADWGDLLTYFDRQTFTYYNGEVFAIITDPHNFVYDEIGNPLSDGTWTYTWQQGRQLASMSSGTKTWIYTYDANGMRTSRTDGTTTYTYLYSNGLLTQMTKNGVVLYFTYDAAGMPLTVQYNGTVYYYVTNLQGDVIAILDETGNEIAEYSYDAWGRLLNNINETEETIYSLNPLLYRGYVYDKETGLYYLQSRYYNPEIGRFISADNYPSTGQGLTGNNMFAYCGNNPVSRNDEGGEWWNVVIGAVVGAAVGAISTAISGGSRDEIILSAVCGAVSGAFAATGFGGVLGQMAVGALTSAIDSGYQNYNDYKGGEKSFGEALTCTFIDTGMGALFGAKGTDVPDATKALKTSNQIAASYHQAKKILKTTVLHPKTRSAANAVVKAGKKYFWKTAANIFVESALDATVSVGFSKISELYVKAIG